MAIIHIYKSRRLTEACGSVTACYYNDSSSFFDKYVWVRGGLAKASGGRLLLVSMAIIVIISDNYSAFT